MLLESLLRITPWQRSTSLQIFFSPETYKLVRVFIAGTDSVDHELLQAEGISQTVGHVSPVDVPESSKQCTILLLPLSGVLQPFAVRGVGEVASTLFGLMHCINTRICSVV